MERGKAEEEWLYIYVFGVTNEWQAVCFGVMMACAQLFVDIFGFFNHY